jgi:hypothetical protein
MKNINDVSGDQVSLSSKSTLPNCQTKKTKALRFPGKVNIRHSQRRKMSAYVNVFIYSVFIIT